MCSPMPEVEGEDENQAYEPGPCHFYTKCEDEGWCIWPKCGETKYA